MLFRIDRRALSLAEVLVVAAIFSGLLVSLAAVEIMARRVSIQHDNRSEVYRAAWLGVQSIRSELESALVEPVDPASGQVNYHPFLRSASGQPDQSTATGELLHQNETVTLLYRVDGWLVRRQPSLNPTDRKLAFLGTQGHCRFERLPDQCDLLKLEVLARFPSSRDNGTVREYLAQTQILLSNQR